MALYTASFGKRIVAIALDGAAVAVIVATIVYGVNAIAWQWDTQLLDPFWETPEVVQTLREPAGEPSTVKQDGIERTTQFLRETRVYKDGAVRIYSVVEGSARMPDGSVVSGRAENLIGESAATYWRRRITYAVIGLVVFLYYGVFEASTLQGTLGKQLLGLRVTDLKGRRLPTWRAWFRQVAKLATVAMSGLGYLPALFTVKAQTIHDIIAGTLVVTGRSEAVSPYSSSA
jgi:uncharacterized RDD family membrane protein YckC